MVIVFLGCQEVPGPQRSTIIQPYSSLLPEPLPSQLTPPQAPFGALSAALQQCSSSVESVPAVLWFGICMVVPPVLPPQTSCFGPRLVRSSWNYDPDSPQNNVLASWHSTTYALGRVSRSP